MFDDRKKAQESKFAHDADLAFRTAARRNRLAGEWAGGILGKTGAALDGYKDGIVGLVTQFPADRVLCETRNRLAADLEGTAGAALVSAMLSELQGEAARQVAEG